MKKCESRHQVSGRYVDSERVMHWVGVNEFIVQNNWSQQEETLLPSRSVGEIWI